MTNGALDYSDLDPTVSLNPRLDAEDPLMSDDGKVTPESLDDQLRNLSSMMTWTIGLMAMVILGMLGTVSVLWRTDGRQEAQLESIDTHISEQFSKIDRNSDRISAIESTRFSLADGQRFFGEIAAKVDAIRVDLSDLRSDVAVLKSKEKRP